MAEPISASAVRIISPQEINALISKLAEEGYDVIGPKVEDKTIVLSSISGSDDLPIGITDIQDGGKYRIERSKKENVYFDYMVPPHTWKRYLFPPEQVLWQAQCSGKGFTIKENDEKVPRYAFLGVRACDIAAMAIHDKVFDNGDFVDPIYKTRRDGAFIVAVNCMRSGNTCFCASMNTGPAVQEGYDILLTEVITQDRHHFLIQSGSPRGQAIVAKLNTQSASEVDVADANRQIQAAAKAMGRTMSSDAAEILSRNQESAHWEKVAERCLNCANCTLACPTCFCSTVEDTTDLSGHLAERQRKWDSCFTIDFSYIHGGAIRSSGAERYRQWISHKLLHWYNQFGMSGCTGCGRCIICCPVGIDITEEVQTLHDNEGRK